MAVWRSAHAPDAFQALIFARGKLAATWSRDQVREGVVQPADFLLLNLVRCSIRSAYRRRLHCRSDARQSRGHVGRLYDVMRHTGEQLLERFSDVNGANVDVFPTSEPPVSRDCELHMPDLHADEEDRHASRFLHLHLRAGSEQTTLCQVLFGPVDASMMLVLVRRAANNKAASSKFQLSQDAASSVAACSRFLRKSGAYCNVGLWFRRLTTRSSIRYYFPKFPGLVHFIFVDRCTGEFFAPRMTSLAAMGRFNCGPRARASTKGTGLKSLRAELCQMRNFAHQCNASFPVVTVRKDKIQHVARRWSQDTERMQVMLAKKDWCLGLGGDLHVLRLRANSNCSHHAKGCHEFMTGPSATVAVIGALAAHFRDTCQAAALDAPGNLYEHTRVSFICSTRCAVANSRFV